MTGHFLKLQQATRVAEQHLAIVGQCDAARCPPEQGTLGLELKPLDLLTYRRLRQVQPLGRSVKAAALSHGNEGAQQLEIQHGIDPKLLRPVRQFRHGCPTYTASIAASRIASARPNEA